MKEESDLEQAEMDLQRNPFHVLRATTRDSRHKIFELAEKRVVTGDESVVSDARLMLTNSRRRLSAELAWFPGTSPRRVQQCIYALTTDPATVCDQSTLDPMARANLLAAGLLRAYSTLSKDKLAAWIFELAQSADEVAAASTLALLNEDRAAAQFPLINDLRQVEDELAVRRRHFVDVIKRSLTALPARDRVDVITSLVDSSTSGGSVHAPVLLEGVVHAFEVEAQSHLNSKHEYINSLISEISLLAASNANEATLNDTLSRLEKAVQEWDLLAQPIQLIARSRGIEHDASNRLAEDIRNLALMLYNDHEYLDSSRRLTSLSLQVFAEVDEIARQASEDASTLEEISQAANDHLPATHPSTVAAASTHSSTPLASQNRNWPIGLGGSRGEVNFDDLPRATQQGLLYRQAEAVPDQFRSSLSRVGWNYAFIAIALGWFAYLYGTTSGAKWAAFDVITNAGITLFVVGVISFNVIAIAKWVRASLKPNFYLTPMYFIRTGLDRVSYWPLWDLTDIKVTHSFTNHVYQSSRVQLDFEHKIEVLVLESKERVEELMAALRRFDSLLREAVASGLGEYVRSHDEFAEVSGSSSSEPTLITGLEAASICLMCVFLCFGGLAVAVEVNDFRSQQAWIRHPLTAVEQDKAYSTSTTPAVSDPPSPSPASTPSPLPENRGQTVTRGATSPNFDSRLSASPQNRDQIPTLQQPVYAPPQVEPAFNHPPQPLPANGTRRLFTTAKCEAPLEIKADSGTDFLVKLVDRSAGKTALTVFVRRGQTTEIEVPLGSFELRYASGETWFGDEYLFGPDTSYFKADEVFTFKVVGQRISGYTVILYKVADGNLSTTPIDPIAF